MRSRTAFAVLAAAACFLFAYELRAGWISVGPTGGYVNALVARPDRPQTLFAATGGGVFASLDGGSSWRSSGSGISVPYVVAIAIDPATPDTMYAGTAAGLFRSSDGGRTWHRSGLETWYISGVAVDPSDGRRLFASANGAAFRSEDRGATWVTALYEDANFYSVAASPAVAYLGGQNGVRKSIDRGLTWTNASDGIAMPSLVFSVAIDPHDASRVYAGTTAGFYVSTDAGAHWTRAAYGNENFVYAVTCDPDSPGVAYAAIDGAGVWRSSDGGASLHDITADLPQKLTRTVVKTRGSLYVGTQFGIYATTDGTSWRGMNFGLTNYLVSSLAIDPDTPSTLYAAGREIFRSVDGGSSWFVADSGPPSFVASLAVPARTPGTIYAGTDREGIFRSRDGGRTWTAINEGMTDRQIYALAIDPANPATIYAGAAWGRGVWKSVDGGEHWTVAGGNQPVPSSDDRSSAATDVFGNVFALAIDPLTPATLYAGTAEEGVFKSVDAGASWTQVEALAGLSMYSLAVDPHDPRFVYAGTYRYGFFWSSDGGATWKQAQWSESDVPRSVFSIAVDPLKPGVIYAGSDGGGVYRSDDRGVTWRRYSDGMQAGLTIYALAIPRGGHTVYAGSGTGGVFRFEAERARPVKRR